MTACSHCGERLDAFDGAKRIGHDLLCEPCADGARRQYDADRQLGCELGLRDWDAPIDAGRA